VTGNNFILFRTTNKEMLVVVEVLGFGTMCICRAMLTFRRNMLSPSSGAEVTRQGSRGFI
jgi:hypothetical protein